MSDSARNRLENQPSDYSPQRSGATYSNDGQYQRREDYLTQAYQRREDYPTQAYQAEFSQAYVSQPATGLDTRQACSGTSEQGYPRQVAQSQSYEPAPRSMHGSNQGYNDNRQGYQGSNHNKQGYPSQTGGREGIIPDSPRQGGQRESQGSSFNSYGAQSAPSDATWYNAPSQHASQSSSAYTDQALAAQAPCFAAAPTQGYSSEQGYAPYMAAGGQTHPSQQLPGYQSYGYSGYK